MYDIDYEWPFEITEEELKLEQEIWERVKATLLEKAYAANAETRSLSESPNIVVFKATV